MISYDIPQNSASIPLLFLLVSSSDHISPVTGAAPTVTIGKNGGAFAAPAGAVSEVGSGWYKVAPNGTDSNTLGPLALHATATGADPCDALYMVVAYNPQSATNLGLSALPTAAPAASGGLVTVGTGSGQINPTSGGVDLRSISGSAVNTASAQLGVNVVNIGGLASAGAAGYVGVDWGHLTNATATVNLANTTISTSQAVASAGSLAGNVTVGGYAAGQDPATLVLGATASSWNAAGTIGHDINAAGTATDPWTTSLPGAYGAGTAGYLIGHNLDAQVSTRLAAASYTAPPTAATIAAAVLTDTTDTGTAGSLGYLIGHAPAWYTAPPTVGQIATAVLTDTTASDLAAAGSLGHLVTTAPSWYAAPLALATTLSAPRALDAVADGSMTVADALWAAVCSAAGKESVVGTSYVVKTPSTGTVLRTFTLDSGTSPTQRS